MKPPRILRTKSAGILAFGLLWVGLLTGIVLVRSSQDIRQEAFSPVLSQVLFTLRPSMSYSRTWVPELSGWNAEIATTSAEQLLRPEFLPTAVTESQEFAVETMIHGTDLYSESTIGMALHIAYDSNMIEFLPDRTTQHPIYNITLNQSVSSALDQSGRKIVSLTIGRDPEIEAMPTVLLTDWIPATFSFRFTDAAVALAQQSNAPIYTSIQLMPDTVVLGPSSDANTYTYPDPVSLPIGYKPSVQPTNGPIQMQLTFSGIPVENNPEFLKGVGRNPLVQIGAYNINTLNELPTQAVQSSFVAVANPSTEAPHHFATNSFSIENMTPGVYQFTIKGPLHQQMRICQENQPIDYVCQPNEGIELTQNDLDANTNIQKVIDVKSRPLMCGDLPITGTNRAQQDGKVNSRDYSYILGCLSKRNDPTCVSKADCDGDAVITNRDMNLLLNTLSVAYDQ